MGEPQSRWKLEPEPGICACCNLLCLQSTICELQAARTVQEPQRRWEMCNALSLLHKTQELTTTRCHPMWAKSPPLQMVVGCEDCARATTSVGGQELCSVNLHSVSNSKENRTWKSGKNTRKKTSRTRDVVLPLNWSINSIQRPEDPTDKLTALVDYDKTSIHPPGE